MNEVVLFPQWLEDMIANHPRMVATEETAQTPLIIPGCFWSDDSEEGSPAEVAFAEDVLTLRGTPPGHTAPIEIRFLLDELVDLTVFALCSEVEEGEDEEE